MDSGSSVFARYIEARCSATNNANIMKLFQILPRIFFRSAYTKRSEKSVITNHIGVTRAKGEPKVTTRSSIYKRYPEGNDSNAPVLNRFMKNCITKTNKHMPR